jgi:hypothetical protein
MNRFASVGRDQGIAMYNQETLEWQERMKLEAGKKIAVAVPTDDFIKDALALFDSPSKPDGEAT